MNIELNKSAKIRIAIYFTIVSTIVFFWSLHIDGNLLKSTGITLCLLILLSGMLAMLIGVSSQGKTREFVMANLRIIVGITILLQAIAFLIKTLN